MNNDKYYGLVKNYERLKKEYRKYKGTVRCKIEIFAAKNNLKWLLGLMRPKDQYYQTVLSYLRVQILRELKRRRLVKLKKIKPKNSNIQPPKKKR
jgi:hypothetical protein